MCRKIAKDRERTRYEEYLQTHSLETVHDLQYLLVRLLFFYDRSDKKRLIAVGQFILRNSHAVINEVAVHAVWQHRINRLLLLSISQLFATDVSHAIPLRLLELFTKNQAVQEQLQDPEQVRNTMEATFSFLVRNGFFSSMRRLLDLKTPPLDGPTIQSPTPFSEALLQLVIRPLALISERVTTTRVR